MLFFTQNTNKAQTHHPPVTNMFSYLFNNHSNLPLSHYRKVYHDNEKQRRWTEEKINQKKIKVSEKL